MGNDNFTFAYEARLAKSLYGDLSKTALKALAVLIRQHKISLERGDIKSLNGTWYEPIPGS
jgi:hypothetical protein